MMATIRDRWTAWRRRRLVRWAVRELAGRGIQVSEDEVDRRLALLEIRGHLAAFGHDVSDLSDEEIESGVLRFAAALRECGLTAAEFAAAMQSASRAAG